MVLGSANAAEGLERFRTHDAIINRLIADVILPGSSGVQVALKLFDPSLKVILTSGYPETMWPEDERGEKKGCRPTVLPGFLSHFARLPCWKRKVHDQWKYRYGVSWRGQALKSDPDDKISD